MYEAVLLLDAAPNRQVNFGAAVFGHGQGRVDQRHRILAHEAGADALGEEGVGDLCHTKRFYG
jgi:hypothetical protein